VVPARQATYAGVVVRQPGYIGWRGGMAAQCWSQLYPPSQAL
jgi:hypothetical protein